MEYHVKCEKCDHTWIYKGSLKHRIRCPGIHRGKQCRSSRNKINLEKFGEWHKELLRRYGKKEKKN